MSISIEDLKPKPFTITIKGVKMECKPLRVSHALTVSKMGSIFNDPSQYSKKQIKEAEQDLDEVIAELVQDIKDIHLDLDATLEVITQLTETMIPTENKELAEAGVELTKGPKG